MKWNMEWNMESTFIKNRYEKCLCFLGGHSFIWVRVYIPQHNLNCVHYFLIVVFLFKFDFVAVFENNAFIG